MGIEDSVGIKTVNKEKEQSDAELIEELFYECYEVMLE